MKHVIPRHPSPGGRRPRPPPVEEAPKGRVCLRSELRGGVRWSLAPFGPASPCSSGGMASPSGARQHNRWTVWARGLHPKNHIHKRRVAWANLGPRVWGRAVVEGGKTKRKGFVPRPPHVQPPPRVHGSPPPRGEPSPSDGSPPGGGEPYTTPDQPILV